MPRSWSREVFPSRRSVVAFWTHDDGTLRFRASRFAEDGTQELRCEADGRCIESARGTPLLEFRFRVERRDGDEGIFVDCDGTPLAPGVTPIHYVLRFEVEPGGRELRAARVELNHRPLERPSRPDRYRKVSDDPSRDG